MTARQIDLSLIINPRGLGPGPPVVLTPIHIYSHHLHSPAPSTLWSALGQPPPAPVPLSHPPPLCHGCLLLCAFSSFLDWVQPPPSVQLAGTSSLSLALLPGPSQSPQ
jgi:hypothetical protein